MLERVVGDLFHPDWGLDAIGHGCNALGMMGAGIALEIKRRFPEAYRVYARECREGTPTLGSFTWARNPIWVVGHVYNIITQPALGACASSEAITKGVKAVIIDAATRGIQRLGLPLLGAGIGGLRQEESEQAIELGYSQALDNRGWRPHTSQMALVLFTEFYPNVGRPHLE